jgi:pimeloyl-ACP methyl ester carboxylesterase
MAVLLCSLAFRLVTLAAVALPALQPPQEPGAASGAFEVVSADGTRIAAERAGSGPELVLVGGALSDRTAAAPLALRLAADFTVVVYDRRGRGQSTDTPPYAVAREVEDLAAVIAAGGGSAYLFGSSSGAVLALEAGAALPDAVRGLALFEPPFVVDDSRAPIADDLFARIGAEVEAGRRGAAVALFMTEGVGVPEEMLAGMRAAPMWAGLERLAHTLPYDGALLAGLQGGTPLPRARWQAATMPVLVLDGGASPPALRNAARALVGALPDAEGHTLEGLDHSAASLRPDALAPVLVEFFGTLGRGH